jgi:hypothetical protein
MSHHVNKHKFNLQLPMYPHEPDGMPCTLEMDGNKLKGVTGLHVRAAVNGFTNVVMEFEASCAVEFVGHLVAHCDANDALEFQMAEIYSDALADVEKQLEGEVLEYSHFGKAKLTHRIIELAMERIK